VVALAGVIELNVSDGSVLLVADGHTIVLLVPLTERSSINLDDGVLHQSLGTDQLVVGGVVDNVQDTGLARAGLSTPGEVTGVQTEGTELHVASTAANGPDGDVLGGAQLGVGCRTSHLELALLPPWGGLAAGGTALVERIT